MTLHIATITAKHIVCVSDRLLSSSNGSFLELANDRYKHLVLIADDGSAIISFAGIAGTINSEGDLENSTLKWITHTCDETSRHGGHTINEHLKGIKSNAPEFIKKFNKEHDLRLAILAVGQSNGEQFICVIDNYLNEQLQESVNIKQEFTIYSGNFSKNTLRKGYTTFYLGSGKQTALKQKALAKKLGFYAKKNDPKNIFDTSVQIVKEVAPLSGGTVGTNCSGVRISLNDPGIKAYNHREGVTWDSVMPNVVVSQSSSPFGASFSVSDITFVKDSNPKPPAVLKYLKPPENTSSLEDQLKFWYRANELLPIFHNQQSYKLGLKKNKRELNKFYLWRDEKYDPVQRAIHIKKHEIEKALEVKDPKTFNTSHFTLLWEEQRSSDFWDKYIDLRDIEEFSL